MKVLVFVLVILEGTKIYDESIEYGSIEQQIEFITEKGLEAWKTNVQSIKTKYPKE